jgi:predicted N-formylglutamate amidohydrolase
VLYNRDRRFAAPVLEALRAESGLVVGENEPYFVSDATDYTIPQHAEARGLLHVEIEVRQDLVTRSPGQDEWARRIARALRFAQRKLTSAPAAMR